MSSVGASSGNRAGTAYAAAAAAKERRQKIIAAVLGVVIIAVFAYEIPQLLKIIRGSKAPVAVQTTATTPQVVLPSSSARVLRTLRHHPPGDPFAQPAPSGVDPGPRAVAVPAGSVDPFAPPGTTSSIPSTTASATASPLPEQIVIGTPGGNRVASHGWIVILASIPTGEGISSANTFAAKAKKQGLTPVSVLNSSNRRPLRGGYWVVYTGPYATLSAVTNRAGAVHTLGYPTAYIRELIVYR